VTGWIMRDDGVRSCRIAAIAFLATLFVVRMSGWRTSKGLIQRSPTENRIRALVGALPTGQSAHRERCRGG
jgi:hypothetical protein